MQKIYTIELDVRQKSNHHCGERTPLPCWPHHNTLLVRTRNANHDTWKAAVCANDNEKAAVTMIMNEKDGTENVEGSKLTR